MAGDKHTDRKETTVGREEQPIQDLRAKDIDEDEAEHLKGGLSDITFTKRVDKSSPSL